MLDPFVIATAKKGLGLLKDAQDAEARSERVQLDIFEDTLHLIRECEAAGGDIPLRARVIVYINLSYLMSDKSWPFAEQAKALKERLPWLSEDEFRKYESSPALILAAAEARTRLIRYRQHHAGKDLKTAAPKPLSLADLTPPKPRQSPPAPAPAAPKKAGPKGLNL